jgi:hypothetical protein
VRQQALRNEPKRHVLEGANAAHFYRLFGKECRSQGSARRLWR